MNHHWVCSVCWEQWQNSLKWINKKIRIKIEYVSFELDQKLQQLLISSIFISSMPKLIINQQNVHKTHQFWILFR